MQQTLTHTSRAAWMDTARALAIVLVVVTHATEQAGYPEVWYQSWAYSIHRLGVPIFLMLSGALILKKCEGMSVWGYYKRYTRRILQFILLYYVCFFVTDVGYEMLVHAKSYGVARDIAYKHIDAHRTGVSAIQLWYMPVIIAFYALAPFISRCVSTLRIGELWVLIGIASLCLWGPGFLVRKSTAMLMGAFFVYFVAGYALVHRVRIIHNWKMHALVGVLFLMPMLILFALDMEHGKMQAANHWYSSSVAILVSSIALFLWLKEYGCRVGRWRWVVCLSKCSFGIYLWHYVIMYAIVDKVPTQKNDWAQALECSGVYFVGAFAGAWLLTWLVGKVPLLRMLVR